MASLSVDIRARMARDTDDDAEEQLLVVLDEQTPGVSYTYPGDTPILCTTQPIVLEVTTNGGGSWSPATPGTYTIDTLTGSVNFDPPLGGTPGARYASVWTLPALPWVDLRALNLNRTKDVLDITAIEPDLRHRSVLPALVGVEIEADSIGSPLADLGGVGPPNLVQDEIYREGQGVVVEAVYDYAVGEERLGWRCRGVITGIGLGQELEGLAQATISIRGTNNPAGPYAQGPAFSEGTREWPS